VRRLVTIIIATRNRVEHLRATLESLRGLAVGREWPAEILVVDNGSTDGTPELVKSFRLPQILVRYCQESAIGLACARNRGLAEAAGQIILFTDDDVRVPTNWIREMVEPMLIGRADATAGAVRLAPQLVRDWMTAEHRGWLAEFHPQAERAQDIVGANMGFTKKLAAKIGGFDEELGAGRLGFGEETQFYWKAITAGFRVAGLPHVEVTHHFDGTRLGRAVWLKAAAGRGKTEAYRNFKYLKHSGNSPQWRIWQQRLYLRAWRLTHPQEAWRTEGCDLFEMMLVKNLFYHLHTRVLFRGANPGKR
jgi:glucosyl-dolichyl phosphate glucuronosyltransferase